MDKQAPVILFADRDVTCSRPLRVELRRRGARVVTAASAAQARDLARTAHPDLVVLEAELVEAEGLEALVASAFHEAEVILLASTPAAAPQGCGLGLLFSGTKPISQGTLLDLIGTALPGRLNAVPARPGPGTVLCVDDDALYLKSLSRLLTRHGYQVVPCQNAERALAALPEVHPDLAILDVRMPGMDGISLTERIRRDSEGKVPVVLLSAFYSAKASTEGRQRGADYYLAKTSGPEKVLDVVDFLVGDLDAEERELLKSRL